MTGRGSRPAAGAPHGGGPTEPERVRLDKWLWRARFYKTRSAAAAAAQAGKVRVNGVRQTKPGAGLKAGDALTIARPGRVDVVRIVSPGLRRGPAAEAAALYQEVGPDTPSHNALNDAPPLASRGDSD